MQKRSIFNPGVAGVQKRWFLATVLASGYVSAGCMMVAGLDDHQPSSSSGTSTPTSKDDADAGLLGKEDTDSAVLPDSDFGLESSVDARTLVDSGLADSGKDSAPIVCEPYSCKPGCECDIDAGMSCGRAGSYACGSNNCARFSASIDGGFPCTSASLPNLHACNGPMNDNLPGCTYSGTSMNTRWYCCK